MFGDASFWLLNEAEILDRIDVALTTPPQAS